MFCPQALVDYKTQDHPVLMDYLDRQHRIPLDEVSLNPGDISRRLGQRTLEYVWTRGSPEIAELPLWAKQDEFVKNLMDQESTSKGTSMEGIESTNSIPPSQSPGTPLGLVTHPNELVHPTTQVIEEKSTKPKFQPKKSAKGRKKKAVSTTTTRPSGITKTLRSDAPPATRTRSRKVTQFFELGHDSRARRTGLDVRL